VRTILDAFVEILHSVAYKENRKLSAIEPFVFLYSSIIPLADFFNRTSIETVDVVTFWGLVSKEWPLALDFIENDLSPLSINDLKNAVIDTGLTISLWAVGSPKRPEHWRVFNLNDMAFMAYPRWFEPGSYGPGGLFAYLSLRDPFCKHLAEDFKSSINKESGKKDAEQTVG